MNGRVHLHTKSWRFSQDAVEIRNIGRDLDFSFDRVLGPDVSQTEVFDSVQAVIEGILEGYNGSILAYGQVGQCASQWPDLCMHACRR